MDDTFTLSASFTEYVEIFPIAETAAPQEMPDTSDETETPTETADQFVLGPLEIVPDEVLHTDLWELPPGVTLDLNGHGLNEWRAFVDGMGGPEGFYMAATGAIHGAQGYGYATEGTITFHGADGGFSFD